MLQYTLSHGDDLTSFFLIQVVDKINHLIIELKLEFLLKN